ncbi:MAG: hypothetical protein JSR87_10885 [Proteobacteria bacterium]|nr:hypothetical protein [Pseudomonadota bacterium]MBS0574440.1 hypothetical protein [Pseudomonadota bacterium]
MNNSKKQNPISGLLTLAILGGIGWYFFGGGLQRGVAQDFESQYNMAKQSGTLMDVCVRAGLVAEGYLQAGDQPNYTRWKGIQKRDCGAAGLPDM